ncbi:4Fe-4S single cluster domain-containing protein [Falsiroseomonas sp. HW251]|uniref:4Fe-4S single cluster domain-containing protein n=1 Tax=Falsiroseomonas sp. HW251 TaxID=3390998 RepID=UPI003D30F955
MHFPVTTLGPGQRLGIWFQGCSIRCPGCVSVDTWASIPPKTTVELLLGQARDALAIADGVTVSGGEPFDQPDALEQLLIGIRTRSPADILVFSGYSLERLAPQLLRLDGLIDCLVADPFDGRAPQSRLLRGSDNQRLAMLTPLGHQRFAAFDRALDPSDRVLDVVFDDETGQVFLVGIPRPGDMRKLASILSETSLVAVTTEAKVPTA